MQPSQELSYQLFATMATFYVPLVIILLLYWRIFKTARTRIRNRGAAKARPVSGMTHATAAVARATTKAAAARAEASSSTSPQEEPLLAPDQPPAATETTAVSDAQGNHVATVVTKRGESEVETAFSAANNGGGALDVIVEADCNGESVSATAVAKPNGNGAAAAKTNGYHSQGCQTERRTSLERQASEVCIATHTCKNFFYIFRRLPHRAFSLCDQRMHDAAFGRKRFTYIHTYTTYFARICEI